VLWINAVKTLGEPGRISVRMARAVGFLGVVFSFALDLLTGIQIRVDTLYFLPLAIISLHVPRAAEAIILAVLIAALKVCAVLLQGSLYTSKVYAAIELLNTVVTAALTIALSRQIRACYRSALDLATTDVLTGISNRRAFEASLYIEISRQRRYGGSFSLAVIDLDGFKAVNDSQGHVVGDKVLRQIADILTELTRRSDVICRLGGDEFAILMLNARRAESARVCGLLVDAVAASMRDGIQVTASIGCVTFDAPPADAADAIHLADQAMYVAKRNGKGCVVAY